MNSKFLKDKASNSSIFQFFSSSDHRIRRFVLRKFGIRDFGDQGFEIGGLAFGYLDLGKIVFGVSDSEF